MGIVPTLDEVKHSLEGSSRSPELLVLSAQTDRLFALGGGQPVASPAS